MKIAIASADEKSDDDEDDDGSADYSDSLAFRSMELQLERISTNIGVEVFPFESVSLKTYLPDGDIDLTALSPQTFEDPLANEVRAVLERAENRKDTGFVVKDVQYINAEVDRLIGKDHLFKRSSILIKSWCYYESRILGAHHGVISTYALETMVLYIFQLFHSSLDGPLAVSFAEEVLYRLLDHYYKFDWDSYRISLYGPVPISYLPEIAAETPDNDGGELLPEKKFLRVCVDMLAVPSRRPNSNSKSFPQKNFNIVDPLKENNNLGKIVSKGNFYRIRSAFTYGARKLGQILLLQVDDVCGKLNKFFMNTLERHGSGKRPDVTGTLTANGSTSASSDSAADEGPTENGSHRRPSGGLISSLERLGYIKGKIRISACPLVGDSSKLVINAKVDSSGGDGSAASDGSSGSSSTPESDGISVNRTEESGEALPDLDGDYDNHMYSLACARSCYDGGPYLHFAPAHSSEFHQNPQFSYDMYQGLPHMPYRANVFSHMNGVYQGPHYYRQVPPGYGVDDATSRHRVHRGTGTYLPNLHNGRASYRERYSSANGNGFTSVLEKVEFGSSTKGSKLSAIISSSTLKQEVPVAARNTNQFLVRMLKGVSERNSI